MSVLACDDAGTDPSIDESDFTLAVDPGELTITRGGSSSATISIERTNFDGEVTLSLVTPPSGVTGAFSPSTSSTSASLVVHVAANTTPGNYVLTIQGTAPGPGTRSSTMMLHVPPPPAAGTVEYLYCSASSAPVFVAYQDGGGPWTPVTASTSGGATRFAFILSQPTGAVLSVYRTSEESPAVAVRTSTIRHGAARWSSAHKGYRASVRLVGNRVATDVSAVLDAYYTEVVYASANELASSAAETCAQTQPTRTVTGIVSAVPAGAYGIVSLGGITDIFDGAASSNQMTFDDVPAGLVDLVGTRARPGLPPDRAIVMRDLNIADGGSLGSPIDFTGPASSVPSTATVTITGGAGDVLEVFTELVTANGVGGFWSDLAPSQAASRTWAGLAPAVMRPGDLHGLVVFATPPGGTGDFRVALKYVTGVANGDLALGPTLAAPATSAITVAAYPRFRFAGAIPGVYDKGVAIDVTSANGPGNAFAAFMTSAYLTANGSGLAYDITMPDISGLAGFPVASRLTAGPNAVAASAFGFTGPGLFDPRPTPGNEAKGAAKVAMINVP